QYPDVRKFVESKREHEPIRLEVVLDLTGDIADGLTALHYFGVVHGDIKPENILLFEDREKRKLIAKICDFGSSGVEISEDSTRGATEAWSPPEFPGSYFDKVAKATWDVYSFGLVACYLATGGVNVNDRKDGMWKQAIEERYRNVSDIENEMLKRLFSLLDE